jgi:hypothetical protein
MPVLCFAKKDQSPPVCAVHNAALLPQQIAIDANAPGLGRVPCHICPISRAVVREAKGFYARNSI